MARQTALSLAAVLCGPIWLAATQARPASSDRLLPTVPVHIRLLLDLESSDFRMFASSFALVLLRLGPGIIHVSMGRSPNIIVQRYTLSSSTASSSIAST